MTVAMFDSELVLDVVASMWHSPDRGVVTDLIGWVLKGKFEPFMLLICKLFQTTVALFVMDHFFK